MLQTPAEYQGKTFTLLIDSGSTHSFLSPRCVRNLSLHEYPDSTLTVELATGKKTKSLTTTGTLNFCLGSENTSAHFRVLPLGIYDGILGMDWLKQNDAQIHCKDALLSFLNGNSNRVSILGKRGQPKLHLVNFSKLMKTYRKKQMVYAVILNPSDKESTSSEPDEVDSSSEPGLCCYSQS